MNNESDEDVRPPIDGYHEPPPFPAESLWAGVEARLPGKRGTIGAERSGRRTVRIPVYWTAAAALALFASGAAVATLLSESGGADTAGEGPADTGSQILPASISEPLSDTRNVVWL